MGKFDGILICSDWDGTLFTGGTVPSGSVEAIRYFQSEGGLFTVCSGRAPDFLRSYSSLVKPNTYAICYNGALICDLDSGEIVKRDFIGPEAYDAVDVILTSGANIKTVNISNADTGEVMNLAPQEYVKRRREISMLNAYKVTISGGSEEDGELMSSVAIGLGMREHSPVRSFCSYVEIIKNENMKGEAASLLKRISGARLLVGMGDYENDIDLLVRADIGYAVANAHESVKRVADRITVSVAECAAAQIIRELEAEISG